MKNRFVLYRRGKVFYCDDRLTNRPVSLNEPDEVRARAIVAAKNDAVNKPEIELAKAVAVLETLDPERIGRT